MNRFQFLISDGPPKCTPYCSALNDELIFNLFRYACVKLYFDPTNEELGRRRGEDDEESDMIVFGRDEVLEANKQVVIECCEMPYWECSASLWNTTIGRRAFAGVPQEYINKLFQRSPVVSHGFWLTCYGDLIINLVSPSPGVAPPPTGKSEICLLN